MSDPISFSCSCGAVTGTVARKPEFLHDCNCSFCSPRNAHWGYFRPTEVSVSGETTGTTRDDRKAPMAEMHRCIACGTTVHFVLTENAQQWHGNVVQGVNMKLADQSALAGVELRFPDGKNWSGDGAIDYVRDPVTLG